MAYETVKRNRYFDGSTNSAPHTSKNHYQDLNDFHIPLERMHNSNLHDWGIARGLSVEFSIDRTEIIVNSGVAIDSIGQLISLSDTGHGDIGENPSYDEHNEVRVPVHLPTASYKGKAVYVTIQFSQILRENEGVLGRLEQVPWVRLQPADNGTLDENSVVLAIAIINEDGLVELKATDSALQYRRHLIGETIEELQIQRPSDAEDKAQDLLSGKIGPGDAGGLKITVPDAQDSILFSREGGGDFKNLEVCANVGIGIPSPSEKLEVNGTIKATAFMGDGSGITVLNGTQITAGTIDDARIPTTISRESRFDPTTGHKHTGAPGEGPKISHSNLEDILPANPASTDATSTKHVSDALAKGWQDHILNKSGNPHGTTARDVGALSIAGGAINGTLQVNGNIGIDGNVGIGTTTPSEKLDVDGNILIDGNIRLNGKNAFEGGDAYLRINQNNEFSGGTHFNYRANFHRGITTGTWWDVEPGVGNLLVQGNVGIGTTMPEANLDVANGGRLNKVAIGTALYGELPFPYESIQLRPEHNLRINFGSKETAIFENSGNLKIDGHILIDGIIGLNGKNAFEGGDAYLRINQNNEFSGGTHFNYRANFHRGITTGTWWDVEPGVGNLLVQGNVGIGTNYPGARLHVEATDKPTIMAQGSFGGLVSGSNGGHGVFGTNIYTDLNNQLKTAGTHNANYGYAGMHASWSSIRFYAADGNTTENGGINPSTRLFISPYEIKHFVKCSQASSRELKKDIHDLSIKEAFKALESLNPVTFVMKDDREETLQVGFIAEEAPDLAATADRKGIINNNIVAVLTKVIKEQQKEIKALTDDVKTLKTNIGGIIS